ncbi:MAG: glycosyl transferase family 2 [Cyanobacteria bacterium RYN_339]|nr:glycosyl transferase family 2 [Cyanobacteria bacterium RYN_339]
MKRFSVVIATYNRGPILEKCLRALLTQSISSDRFEIVVVDDGSTDDTPQLIERLKAEGGPSWQYLWQANRGRSHARNVGIEMAKGELVVFIDSDVVVVPEFLSEHDKLHTGKRVFVQGLAVNTDNFDDPLSTPVGPGAFSAAFFATNNVSVARAYLKQAGGFDENFTEYGWEDLELGLRLKAIGVGMVRSRAARGFHWHPAFSMQDMPGLKRIEEERGRMAAYFFRKHPTLDVRLMIQLTALHHALNWLVTLGGRLDEVKAEPALKWLLERGKPALAQQLAILMLNQYNLRELHAALARPNQATVHG